MLVLLNEDEKLAIERAINTALTEVAEQFDVSVNSVREYIAAEENKQDRYQDIWNYVVDCGEQWTEDYPEGIHSGEVAAIYIIYEDIEDSNYDLWSTIAGAIEIYKTSDGYKNFEFRKETLIKRRNKL